MPLKSRVSPSTTRGNPWITSLAATGSGADSSRAARQPTVAVVGSDGGRHQAAACCLSGDAAAATQLLRGARYRDNGCAGHAAAAVENCMARRSYKQPGKLQGPSDVCQPGSNAPQSLPREIQPSLLYMLGVLPSPQAVLVRPSALNVSIGSRYHNRHFTRAPSCTQLTCVNDHLVNLPLLTMPSAAKAKKAASIKGPQGRASQQQRQLHRPPLPPAPPARLRIRRPALMCRQACPAGLPVCHNFCQAAPK